MRYAQIDPCEIVNGNGVGVSLYVQGCPIRCKGCFNKQTWSFTGGKEWTFNNELEILKYLESPYIKRFSLVGGEPLYEDYVLDLFLLVDLIRRTRSDIDIWLWTGYTWEQLMQRLAEAKAEWPAINAGVYLYGLLEQIDYIVVGPFIEEEKDFTYLWRGSKNQEVLMCEESLRKGKKIYYTE